MIREFQGEYRWLSNFAPVKIILEGREYPSVEHAYMSAKSEKEQWKIFCADQNNSAGQIKRKSKNLVLVENWELIKVETMKTCLSQKFEKNPYKARLLKTGEEDIQEGNNWGDTFWGVCLKTNKGKNTLGKLIMSIRDNLKD